MFTKNAYMLDTFPFQKDRNVKAMTFCKERSILTMNIIEKYHFTSWVKIKTIKSLQTLLPKLYLYLGY